MSAIAADSYCGVQRSKSMSSIRKTTTPLRSRARAQAVRNVRACPMCKSPEVVGATRVLYRLSFIFLKRKICVEKFA